MSGSNVKIAFFRMSAFGKSRHLGSSGHQLIDYRALVQGAVMTLFLETNKRPFHSFKFTHAFSHIADMLFKQFVYFRARGLSLMGKIG